MQLKDAITIPDSLIYEKFDGHIFPYKGFREVLNEKNDINGVTGSNVSQSIFCSTIAGHVMEKLDQKEYMAAINSGLDFPIEGYALNDFAIFNKSEVTLNNKYFEVAPLVAVEVDIRADLTDEDSLSETDYIFKKSKKMIDFGTQQVIWVLTDSKKIIIVNQSPEWKIVDFNADVPILDDIVLNLEQLMKEEELEF